MVRRQHVVPHPGWPETNVTELLGLLSDKKVKRRFPPEFVEILNTIATGMMLQNEGARAAELGNYGAISRGLDEIVDSATGGVLATSSTAFSTWFSVTLSNPNPKRKVAVLAYLTGMAFAPSPTTGEQRGEYGLQIDLGGGFTTGQLVSVSANRSSSMFFIPIAGSQFKTGTTNGNVVVRARVRLVTGDTIEWRQGTIVAHMIPIV